MEATESFASDFAGVALTVGDSERARSAAEFLANEGSTDRLRALGRATLRVPGTHLPLGPSERSYELAAARHEISRLKRTVGRDPRNALAWAELARYYAARGQLPQAERALRVALAVAPDNRFLLRAAACFYVQKDPLQGHDLLLRANHLVHDPWLLAAELALANIAGRTLRHMKAARSMLADGRVAPIHLTELASQVATLELQAGGDKKARRLFVDALTDPTDNSVAQVEWASHRMTGLHVAKSHLALPLAAEARARHGMEDGKWQVATANARLWLADQPFSENAATLGSYVASVGLRDWHVGEEFTARGLRANPGSTLLLNNQAYVLLEQNRIEEARRTLDLIRLSAARGEDEMAALATHGMLSFRSGDPESGRRFYERSMSKARSLGLPLPLALAAIMLAREEVRAGGAGASDAVRQAERLSRGSTNKAVKEWLAEVVQAATV